MLGWRGWGLAAAKPQILMTHPQITQVSRVTHLGVREDAIHEVPSTRVWMGCLGGGVGVYQLLGFRV
jgi:hypothetical protein